MGHVRIIDELLKRCPDSFDLLDDKKGRNFLHIAAEKKMVQVVRYVCNSKKKGLEKLLNQRDNIDGNTPLHLIVSSYKHRSYKAVAALLRDPRVETSIINNRGHTQLDLSSKLEHGLSYNFNIEDVVMRSLANCGAVLSPQRSDHVSHEREKAVDVSEESKKRTTLSRNMSIASVLAATVTFAAGFTMPGGYNSSDGTAVLSKKYPFKAFLISNTCAMVCSMYATVRIILAGTALLDNTLTSRSLLLSNAFLWISFACMAMAFSMATYAVVVPIAWRTGFLVCMISLASPVASIFINMRHLFYMERIIAARNKQTGHKLDSDPVRPIQLMVLRICGIMSVYLVISLLALL